MIGRNINLLSCQLQSSKGCSFGYSPEKAESNHHHYSQQFNGPMFRFLENLDEAVQESRQPKEPLEERCQHHGPHYGNVDDLS